MRGRALIAGSTLFASGGPGFSPEDLVGLLAFVIDGTVGPIFALVVGLALVLRNGWRGWRPILTVLGVLNVLIAGALVVFAGGAGLGELVAIVWLQLVIAVALVVSVNMRPSRNALFGADSRPCEPSPKQERKR